MGAPDSIFQDLANQDPTGLARLVLGDPSVEARGVPANLPIVRRRDGDTLLIVTRGREEFLLHVECELGRRSIGARLLEYVAILAKREHRQARHEQRPERPIEAAVLRLHGPGRAPRRAMHAVPGLVGATATLRYLEISVPGLDAEALLAGGHPALLPLVPLARGGDGDEILHRLITAIETADVVDEQRDVLATSTFVLARIVGAHRMLEMKLDEKDLRKYPHMREWLDKMAAKTKAEVFSGVLGTRLARLGQPSADLAAKVGAVTDAAGLERLAMIAIEVESLAAFEERAFPEGGERVT